MKRSKHMLSHYRLMTGDFGNLYPVSCYEVLPGDTIQHSTSGLVRLAPLNTPVYHPTSIRIHHWFVPFRQIWSDWEQFITGGPDGDFEELPPQHSLPGGVSVGSLFDHLGVAVDPNNNRPYWPSSLPVRAYNHIFNHFYRDQDLVAEVNEDQNLIQRIAWEKDYFAAARPFSQKGSDVSLPLGTRAPIVGLGKTNQVFDEDNADVHETGGVDRTYASGSIFRGEFAQNQWLGEEDPQNPGYPNIHADLSAATALDVNDLRRAFGIQRYQEARARYGSRYVEYLRYLGINPSFARLDLPEFLGGSKSRIQFSEVLQTNQLESGQPSDGATVGDLYGHGIAGVRGNRFRKFFEEHGLVLTLMSVRPKAIYPTATPKMFLRYTKEDYYQRELELIGQEPIDAAEIHYDGNNANTVFGYQDRYANYRGHPSSVAGEFNTELNMWHMGRDFTNTPVLNQSFTDCVPSKRIHQVTNRDQMWAMFNHSVVARRIVRKNATARIL